MAHNNGSFNFKNENTSSDRLEGTEAPQSEFEIKEEEKMNSPGEGSNFPTALGLFPTALMTANKGEKLSSKISNMLPHSSMTPSAPIVTHPLAMDLPSEKRRKNPVKSEQSGILIALKKFAECNPGLTQKAILKIYSFLRVVAAHKWTISEWFLSFLDVAIYEELDNERLFELESLVPKEYLEHFVSFEWAHLRESMNGVPIFSPAFIAKERLEMERRRTLLRLFQKKSCAYVEERFLTNGIPEQIPSILARGTIVQAVHEIPFSGIQFGNVIRFDEKTCAYYVCFENDEEKGEYLLQDTELMTLHRPATVAVSATGPFCSNEQKWKFQIGDGAFVNTYHSSELAALVEWRRMIDLNEKCIKQLAYFNNKVQALHVKGNFLKIKKNEENKMRTKFLRKYAGVLLYIGRIKNPLMSLTRDVKKFGDHLKASTEPQESSTIAQLKEKCGKACHALMLETYVTPTDGTCWKEVVNLLMIFKYLQTIGSNGSENGMIALQSHLNNYALNMENFDNANLFCNVLVPHLEKLIRNIERVSKLKSTTTTPKTEQ